MPDTRSKLTAMLLTVASTASADVNVTGAWLREPPPISAPVAGYLAIENTGASNVAIDSVSSPRFERVEWHSVRMEDGVARMRRVDAPILTPGDRREFKPGGDHLMLFGADGALRAGDVVPLIFTTSEGTKFEVDAVVRAPGAGAADRQHHHHH